MEWIDESIAQAVQKQYVEPTKQDLEALIEPPSLFDNSLN